MDRKGLKQANRSSLDVPSWLARTSWTKGQISVLYINLFSHAECPCTCSTFQQEHIQFSN